MFKNKFLKEIRFSFETGKTPVLFTSRKILSFDYSEQFNFYSSLSCFIAELVADLKYEIGYLISKGGITTNLILSGVMMLEYFGWDEAANLITNGLSKAIEQKKVTYDLARLMEPKVEPLSCSSFAEEIISNF